MDIHTAPLDPFACVRVRDLFKGSKYALRALEVKGSYVRRNYVVGLEEFVQAPSGRGLRFFLPKKFMKLTEETLARLNRDCRHGLGWSFVLYGRVGNTYVCKLHPPGSGNAFLNFFCCCAVNCVHV